VGASPVGRAVAKRTLRLVGLISVALAACSSARGVAPDAGSPVGSLEGLPTPIISVLPAPTTGPFVVVAVDNHFHDIHPEEFNEVQEDRPFEVKNQGQNLHNFTVLGTDISIDIAPGQQFEWTRIGDKLPPGRYDVICTYHTGSYWNMRGQFDVVP
jgi:hypothetical protein